MNLASCPITTRDPLKRVCVCVTSKILCSQVSCFVILTQFKWLKSRHSVQPGDTEALKEEILGETISGPMDQGEIVGSLLGGTYHV